MSEQPRIARCCRLNCQNSVEAVISLDIESNAKKSYSLCLFHYHEVLRVIEGIKAITGMPEERQSEETS